MNLIVTEMLFLFVVCFKMSSLSKVEGNWKIQSNSDRRCSRI